MKRYVTVNNKLTKVRYTITEDVFKNQFGRELTDAINHYINSMQYKAYLYPFKIKGFKEYESEFCFNLQWNFNNYSNSNWYIEKIK